MEMMDRDDFSFKGYRIINMQKRKELILVSTHLKFPFIKITFPKGRGHDVELRIADISVSRCHASIILEEDGFYIIDHDSKFGSLKLLQEPLPINQQT